MTIQRGLGKEACMAFLLARFTQEQTLAYINFAEERLGTGYWDTLLNRGVLYADMELYLSALKIEEKTNEH